MNDIVVSSQLPDFDLVADSVLRTLSERSARVYADTYKSWAIWCENHQINPIQLTPDNIYAFLVNQPVTKTTRQRHMSAMRKMLKILSINYQSPALKAAYEYLCEITVPEEGISGRERNKLALTPAQTEKVLNFWNQPERRADNVGLVIRNHALLNLALATGARRSEIVNLEWRDIDIESGIAHVRNGKGGKSREVALVGDFAISALRSWMLLQGPGWKYVFVPVNKGGKIGPDKPIDPTSYYKMVKRVSAELGIDFSTHDFRRTLITELFVTGASLPDVQAQAGHAHGQTTMIYAQAAGASRRRETFRVRFGE